MTGTASFTIECTGLRVATTGGREVLHGVDFAVAPGEILALVGESGSGKTTAALAALGHFRDGLACTGGSIAFHGHSETHDDLLAADPVTMRGVRGRLVTYVPQDPALSLNPLLRIGTQVAEVLQAHGFDGDVAARVREVLSDVGLPTDDTFLRRYPHQLSGGQQQRVGIAAAFANRPDVVVLDEPTTGLDVTTQDLVLDTVRDLVTRSGTAALYITHDLAVVAGLADRVTVMQGGEVVETGPVRQILTAPEHPYTRALIGAVPDLDRAVDRDPSPSGDGAPLLRMSGAGKRYGPKTVLDGVDLELWPGECLMLLGESGSGKTTLARGLSGLLPLDAGTLTLKGDELTTPRSYAQLRSVQYVFQSPFASLNPRRTIASSLEVPLRHLTDLDADARDARVLDMLGQVRLDGSFAQRYPGGLSGGERQRAAIARALVTAPDVLVCDEVTSALDVSVQASIIELLALVRRELGTAMLFVTHNIALAREVADRIAVLQDGRIVEQGTVDEVLANPQHEYTRQLLEHTPSMAEVR
ncbi:peptide ABC transporter ATP-binding protein [Pseudonocardia sp. EC080610-09]|uniref:ATP-binding cassette domain-containing protein n=1 Tax=unclassified Pseudonocardia TaxID=2619320 RepID=UPI0006CB7DD3|nr:MULTISPECIES: ABC transporter ATP-binding protein [unclassified Pseudonocardia]ALE73413.1 peptide ABC transporter ATP-binding protein [Pseudonocardia sp. EC080625-04]ALL77072.1 peptide ABC transporter ATP-binding protein [Pseudonocardia sp. EC080610-09]ALL84103.1 peptide ABC transporter ATP-binding protein [Pseudonocardia sp. EC080619-01]